MRRLNLGILAHVDAGKTSLTERLLYESGVIDDIGSVDAGNTQTDSLELEQQRGITIKSAVVSFRMGEVDVNLIDTPGHSDFIAEVERALSVLDGAVLVISAVEGVQAQTRVLMRTLQRLAIPVLIFVNKIDRSGADVARVTEQIRRKLTPAIIPMGSVSHMGEKHASYEPYDFNNAEQGSNLIAVLAEHDVELMEDFVHDQVSDSSADLLARLAKQTQDAIVHPVFFGSAITGAGIKAIQAGIQSLLPAIEWDGEGALSGTAFKVERADSGEKVAIIRLFRGRLRVREQIPMHGEVQKVTAISVYSDGSDVQRDALCAGEIGRVRGLTNVRIGDVVGDPPIRTLTSQFPPPTLETVIFARDTKNKGALRAALDDLAEQDPLINLRQDDIRQQMFLSLYGEVQKEVIEDTLLRAYGIAVGFRETTVICVERVNGIGSAAEFKEVPPNPFLATVGMRVEPGLPGSGTSYGLEVELGSMPSAFMAAVEASVRECLRQGLYGWEVLDCKVTLTHSGYSARQSHSHATFDRSMSSTAADFRNLTPLVLMDALAQAGTTVFEPVHRFHLDAPADTLGSVLPALGRLDGRPEAPVIRGAECSVEGEIPAVHVHEVQQMLPSLTRGEGLIEFEFTGYQPAVGQSPRRSRWDNDPTNRTLYLQRIGLSPAERSRAAGQK